jgi:very-short-patch-repair endonuclease
VVVPRNRAHLFAGLVVHRSGDLEPADLTTVRHVPTTTATRTLVDMGLIVRPAELELAMHRALQRGLTTIDHLVATYVRISRRGRAGAGPIGRLLAEYDPAMAAAESALELVILRLLRAHGVPEPVRQFVVVVDGHEFRLDMAYPLHRLFLEGDGFGVHGGRGAFEDDRWRQNLLVVHGWWPLRITWRQARQRPAECAAFVARKLAEIERSWG